MAEPTQEIGRSRVGERLVHKGIITPQQLDQALAEQRQTRQFLGAILVSHGWADEAEVAKALSEQLGLAYVDLNVHPLEPEATALIPEALCKAHQVLPLFTLGDQLTVAMADPLNTAAIEQLQQVAGKQIRPVVALPSEIARILEEGPRGGVEGTAPPAVARGQASAAGMLQGASEPAAQLKEAASLAPVVQIVDQLIQDAVASHASDVHLEPMEGSFACRFRIDGILHERPAFPKGYQAAVISRIKIMGNMDISEKRLPQDGRIQAAANDRQVDLRVSTFPTIHGENVVIRILDKQRGLVKLEVLGFSKPMYETFSTLIEKPNGIILVTGPTGSGKTTTLYAALQQLDHVQKNIMTMEDPVEYELSGIRQAQVNVKAGLTFAAGLRSLVRQDPDVILIGEIRDRETADIAIHASLTGHLVFATLHTNDAASASTRLVDIGVEPFLVATSLIGVLAQRLVRVLCAECKKPAEPPEALLKRLGVGVQEGGKIFKEVGCKRCRGTGYQGRIGIFELLIPNERIRELVTQRVHSGTIREEALKNGLVALKQDGIEKLLQGRTSLAELLRVVGEE